MDRNENFLLNRLDKPLRFLGINKDEALVVVIPLFGGLFMGWIVSGFLVGIGALSLLRTIKKQNEGSTADSCPLLASSYAKKSYEAVCSFSYSRDNWLMKADFLHHNILKVISQRNAWIGISALMAMSNILLSTALFLKNERTILVPPHITKTLWVEGGAVSKEYLEEMGSLCLKASLGSFSLELCL
jgi:hypothetical protein